MNGIIRLQLKKNRYENQKIANMNVSIVTLKAAISLCFPFTSLFLGAEVGVRKWRGCANSLT